MLRPERKPREKEQQPVKGRPEKQQCGRAGCQVPWGGAEAGEGAAREAAARRLPGAVGQVKDVMEPSAPEMEERRSDEQVQVEALPVPEASAPPRWRPHLVGSWWEARRTR